MAIKVAVDAIVILDGSVVLIDRKYHPQGLALPGGHVDEGETLEQAVARELKEETNLDIVSLEQFHTYSDPKRDPRGHYITTVFICNAKGTIKAGSDAKAFRMVPIGEIAKHEKEFAFDHFQFLRDALQQKRI